MANERMTIEEFRNQFKEDLMAGKGHSLPIGEITFAETKKLQNETYTGMHIRAEGTNMGPSIRLDDAYRAYQNGVPYGDIYESFVNVVKNAFDQMPKIDMSIFESYEKIKGHLGVQLVNIEKNKEMLENIPYTKMEDLAIVYRIHLNEDQSTVVTNAMLEKYHINMEQLHADAMIVAPIKQPAIINNLESMIEMMVEEVEMQPIPPIPGGIVPYVAMTLNGVYGAAAITYPGFLDQLAKEVGGDVLILPSSIHEIIAVEDTGRRLAKELEADISYINKSAVDLADQLSDHAYHYDCKHKIFELASDYEYKKSELGFDAENIPERIALETKNGFITIQEQMDGFDFVLYDKDYKDIEGGIYLPSDPDMSIYKALKNIMDERNIPVTECERLDFEQFKETSMEKFERNDAKQHENPAKVMEKPQEGRRESVIKALREKQAKMKVEQKTKAPQKETDRKKGEQSL